MRRIGQILRFLIPVIALAALVAFLAGAGRRERATIEKNKALVMRYCEEVWNKGDMAVADEIIASDFIYHVDTAPEGKGIIRGLDAMKQYIKVCRTAWPDLRITLVEPQMAQGDRTAARWVLRGTFTGVVEKWPAPTGKETVFEGLSMWRFAGGKIAEEWCLYQDTFMWYQMGMKLVPAGKQAAK